MLIPNETHKIRTISRDYPKTIACCLINGPIKFSRYVVINTNETLATLHIRFFFYEVYFDAQFSSKVLSLRK